MGTNTKALARARANSPRRGSQEGPSVTIDVPATVEENGKERKPKRSIVAQTKGAFSKVGHKASDAIVRLDESLAAQEAKNDQHVKQMLDRAMERSVQKVLKLVGTSVNSMLKPAYAPQKWCETADYLHAGAWPDIERQLEDMIMGSVSSSSKKLKAKQLRHWAKAPALWAGEAWKSLPVQPLTWMRCKVLYALLPADANKFRHLGDPLALSIVLAKMTSTYGINVLIFIMLFLIIDRSDESQLVRYILSFKSFQFLSGIIAAAKLGFDFSACLNDVALNPDANCREYAPGRSPSFPWVLCLELVRIFLLLAAGVVLAGGGAWGGPEEILALEDVRLGLYEKSHKAKPGDDDADDKGAAKHAKHDAPYLRQKSVMPQHIHMHKSYARLDAEIQKAHAHGYHSRAEVNAAVAAARLKFGVQKRRGGYLPYFMLYDLAMVSTLLVVLWVQSIWLASQDAPQWLFWKTCYYTKLIWALSACPFLIFAVPVLGESLHQAKTTAYDQAGLLVPALSGSMMKRRIELEQEEERAAELAKLDEEREGELDGAALRIQKIRRGNQARKHVGGRVMRHVISMATPIGLFVSADEIERWFSGH